jgi:hypothetical protein
MDGPRVLRAVVAGVAALAALGFILAGLVLLDAARGDILRSLRLSPQRVDLVEQLRAQERGATVAGDSTSRPDSPDEVRAEVRQVLISQREAQVDFPSSKDPES